MIYNEFYSALMISNSPAPGKTETLKPAHRPGKAPETLKPAHRPGEAPENLKPGCGPGEALRT